MNKEKQIEEMEKHIEPILDDAWAKDYFPNAEEIAEALYNAGYRKASEVAEEIISCIHDEIELALESNYKARKERIISVEMVNDDAVTEYINGKITTLRGIDDFLAELKKKYESEKDNDRD